MPDLPPVLGNAVMDHDHARLAELFSRTRVLEDSQLAAHARLLADEIAQHFAREEAMMEAANFPVLHCHRQFHDELLSAAKAVAEVAAETDPTSLRRILVHRLAALVESHVDSVDRVTAQYLESIGFAAYEPA
jgi:hemerythrin-like metal-binding protein